MHLKKGCTITCFVEMLVNCETLKKKKRFRNPSKLTDKRYEAEKVCQYGNLGKGFSSNLKDETHETCQPLSRSWLQYHDKGRGMAMQGQSRGWHHFKGCSLAVRLLQDPIHQRWASAKALQHHKVFQHYFPVQGMQKQWQRNLSEVISLQLKSWVLTGDRKSVV